MQLLTELLFPKSCAHCKQLYTFLCPQCYNQLCFRTDTARIGNSQVSLEIHSALTYTSVTRSLVRAYKFTPVPELAEPLAQILYDSLTLPAVDLVTAVPLHSVRLRERGFHQTELLAQELAKLLCVPYVALLERTQHTTAQAQVADRNERLQRMEGMFSLTDQAEHVLTSQQHILLVDDVFTTGATLLSCATELHKITPSGITACTIAHG